MLLKIVAFMDRPQERTKDLVHIRDLLSEYEADSERIFGEAFAEGEIKEYYLANAFLLARDLRALCTEEEVEIVRRFVELVGDEDKAFWWPFVRANRQRGEREEETARAQLDTFSNAFSEG